MSKIHQKINDAAKERVKLELALGFVRYEFVRRLKPSEFNQIWMRSMNDRKHFDDIIDELIEKEAK